MIHIYLFILLLILIFIICFTCIFRKNKKFKNNIFISNLETDWNINKNIFEEFQQDKMNIFIDTEVPTDFSTVENTSWKISGNVQGQNVIIESKGRTLWKSNYSPIWSGKWIYHGTVESYKATLNINTVKFLIIK